MKEGELKLSSKYEVLSIVKFKFIEFRKWDWMTKPAEQRHRGYLQVGNACILVSINMAESSIEVVEIQG